MKVAESASNEGGRRRWLAILYDEVSTLVRSASNCLAFARLQECRRAWQQRAFQNDGTLDVAAEAGNINQNALFAAKSKYDASQVPLQRLLPSRTIAHVPLALARQPRRTVQPRPSQTPLAMEQSRCR